MASGWITIKCGSDMNVPFKMNFDDPLTFYLAPSLSENFNLSNTLVHKLPAKLITLTLSGPVFE